MLTVVAQIDGTPHSDQVTVYETEPLVVESHATWGHLLRRGGRVMLLKPRDGQFEKSEVQIVSLQKFRNTHRIGFEAPAWQSTDRRRFPRFECQVPVIVRLVAEDTEGIHLRTSVGITDDLSAGGAWIRSEQTTPEGTVVQVEMNLYSNACRALGVVVRNEPGRDGFGIEFLDFIGSSRYALTDFLRQAA